jgi:hypothetical protein
VPTGDNLLVGGFIIGGTEDGTVLAWAIGPSFTQFSETNALSDPVLELHDASGATIASNDDWKDSQQTEIEATGIPPTNDKESASLVSLVPGIIPAFARFLIPTKVNAIAAVERFKFSLFSNSCPPSGRLMLWRVSERKCYGNSLSPCGSCHDSFARIADKPPASGSCVDDDRGPDKCRPPRLVDSNTGCALPEHRETSFKDRFMPKRNLGTSEETIVRCTTACRLKSDQVSVRALSAPQRLETAAPCLFASSCLG